MASNSYGSGTQAPDDCVDVGLQKSYDTLASVPTHPAGPRSIGVISQAPIAGADASGYASGGNPLKQGEGASGNG